MEQEQIKQARKADLPTYLAAKGEVLKREGRGYRHSVHDSLKIEGNMYCWNSKGTSGNALDFVQEFYGLNFRQAVEELTGEAIPAAASVERPASTPFPVIRSRTRRRRSVRSHRLCEAG